ncbi:hypothetical protein [Gaoshiqia sp. Z1-71]|uniref:hypothetical protein n=1 Tax=Gaoshiqia hydrogeniformans TaxID=3290090 RepID=UPI003BF89496
MEKINSLRELRMLRQMKKQQLRYQEEKIEKRIRDTISTIELILTGIIVEKGIYSLITYFSGRNKKKQDD